jgi:hypothetical protein
MVDGSTLILYAESLQKAREEAEDSGHKVRRVVWVDGDGIDKF